tara:strand:+ start:2221 stop:2799 length:579 start_codon:yes stop_codon:yes gene_type:complete
MALRTVIKTAGHWLKGLVFKVDREIQFDVTTNPEIHTTGGSFIWKTQTNNPTSWKLRDDTTGEDILLLNTSAKTITLIAAYKAIGFAGPNSTTITTTDSLRVDSDTVGFAVITALAEGLTIDFPVGTPTQGQKLIIRIKDDGTARSIAYDSQLRPIGLTLPTTTVANKILYLGFVYNATDSKWDAIALKQEA